MLSIYVQTLIAVQQVSVCLPFERVTTRPWVKVFLLLQAHSLDVVISGLPLHQLCNERETISPDTIAVAPSLFLQAFPRLLSKKPFSASVLVPPANAVSGLLQAHTIPSLFVHPFSRLLDMLFVVRRKHLEGSMLNGIVRV